MLEQFNKLVNPIKSYLNEQDSYIAPSSTHSLLAAIAASQTPLLLVTTSTRNANELSTDLIEYLGNSAVANFPPWETLPHERLSPKSDTVTARFKALNSIARDENRIVVTSIRALLQPIIRND